MKIKVATTFSYRSDSRDGQSGERFISSALTIEPDDEIPSEEIDAVYETDAHYTGFQSQTQSRLGSVGGALAEGADNRADRRKPNDSRVGRLDAPELKSPRFMVIGKPCTGKTTLSKQLCEQYGCELVNATELIEENLKNQTEIGQKIYHIMADGRDLPDELVFDMLKDKLQSANCVRNGYVLDGIPTHSEHIISIEKQLEFIFSLENPPTYLIDIQISNSDLRSRWEDMRIDYVDGKMYPKESYEADAPSPCLNYAGHPDFPKVDAATKERLLTRHEELSENLDKHFSFYDSQVQNVVDNFMSKFDSTAIINVDGHVTPTERLEETIGKLSKLSTRQSHDSCVSASECVSRNNRDPPPSGNPSPKSFAADKSLWLGHPPRLVLFGKPCAGKTTLAKALCQSWSCEYINATELIQHHIANQTPKGQEIVSILSKGEDLTDAFVLDLLQERLNSSECRQLGFILDGIPTFSEKAMTLDTQIKFLEQLYPEPYFWVELDISDEELRRRWETVRIDHHTGKLYTKPSYDTSSQRSEFACEFPTVDEAVKNRLLTRYEELPENLEAHFEFYNQHVAKLMADFLGRCPKPSVIQLDGSLCPLELGQSLIDRLRDRIDQHGLKPAPISSAPLQVMSDSMNQQPDNPTVPGSSTCHAPTSTGQLRSEGSISDYRGSVGDFRVRSRLRSTGSISSQSSANEPLRMAEMLKLANITCVSTEPCTLATAQSASPNPAGVTFAMPDTGQSMESRLGSSHHSKSPCCCQCGAKVTEMSSELWRNKPPRFLIFGKPCTGKTTLAAKMCSEWGCRLINGTELVLRHMAMNDDYGRRIKELMLSGRDLDDKLMIDIVSDELNSPECIRDGFVIDDFPNYSEKSLSVSKQLDFLLSLQPGPDYVIEMQMPDDVLKARWESVKIDLESGVLHVGPGREPRSDRFPSCCINGSQGWKSRTHPLRNSGQLITRFEELAESMESNITFYQEVVEPQIRDWLEKYYDDVTIPMDADMTLNEIFYILQRKMRMVLDNPTVPTRQLFTDKENSFLPGSCCRRCGVRYPNLEPQIDLWPDNPPRILILGKPCTGKTTLAKRLCSQWGCELINATELMQHHLALNTATGKQICSMLSSGEDLPDHFVINMLMEKLNSPGCTESGYILDGIPTHSEKSHSIAAQIDLVRSLDPPPDYLILIEISDAALRDRWESIRIDVADGTLYVSRMFGNVGYHPGKPTGRRTRHPDFPQLDEETRKRLITRHEELPENLDRHFLFYNTRIAPQLQRLVRLHDPSKIVVLNGEDSSIKMMNTLLYKLNVMARNPNVPTAELFTSSSSDLLDESCICQRRGPIHLEPMTELWLDAPPRVVLVGKPCTGKTTLAKRLCDAWSCLLIDASEIIQQELNCDSETGQYIRKLLAAGHDLDDQFVLDLIRQTVCSPLAKDRGYILIGIPTHSEKSLSIEDQLTFLRGFENGPDYIIEIQMDDDQLRDRWEAIRIDVADGALYSKLSYDRSMHVVSGRGTRHPDFPIIDEVTKNRLLTRHEELPENLNLHFEFYNSKVEGPLQQYIAKHDPSKVVRVNGNLSPSELLQAVLVRMSLMARHPGVDTATLFPTSNDDSEDAECACQCQRGDVQEFRFGSGVLWKNDVPRIVIVGNSCSGKSTLAKRLSKEWNCPWVNASDLILHHLNSRTSVGDQIVSVLVGGKDLDDDFVLRLLEDKLKSPECIERGYVLDDFPTSSEKEMSIKKQLEMLNALPNRPEYVINIMMPEEVLHKRWQSVRIDLADGVLYPDTKLSLSNVAGIVHPKFPTPSEHLRQRLITRHEDLCENVEKQSRFYTDYVEPHIVEFLQQYEGDHIVTVDGTRSNAEMYKFIYNALLQANKASTDK